MKKRKMVVVGIAIFLHMFLVSIPGVHCEQLRQPLDVERQNLSKDSDLILEGAISDVRQIEDADIDAVDGDITKYKNISDAISIRGLDLRWIITFTIDKIIKGECQQKEFRILVHSPAESFGFIIADMPIDEVDKIRGKYPGKGYGKKYRIYTKLTPNDRMIIGKEEIK